jgi:7,8-dihydropterin-6-yl-methyl-4-(beta-D-ribofuranosyl)aminobenzene 5'-phosphate synthase
MFDLTRRAVLTGSVAALAVTRLPAAARMRIPEIDSLAVRFVVDGSLFALARPINLRGLRVEPPPTQAPVKSRFLAEWGLSLLLDARQGSRSSTTMLDFGYSREVLGTNMALLGIDPASIDALVLSHGHYDHFGGLSGLLSSGRVRRGTPLYVGGEEALCHRLRGIRGNLDFGAVDTRAISAAGVRLTVARDPVAVGGGFTTGQIPLVVEHPSPPSRMEPGVGCARELLDADKRSLDVVEDDSRHELGLAFHLRNKGLIVLGSCSHRGILNTIRQARLVSGIDKLHAVIGGFHLVAPQTEEDARRTATAMAALSPAFVVPGHCSGEWFIAAAQAAMPRAVIRPYVGQRFIFESTA